jgi:FAD/FMN-containing dehydrogenase/Fe-S oxidoreductase
VKDHANDLRRALVERLRGEVRFDDGSRGLYATDASNYRQVPIGVVVPRDTDDVIVAVEVCRAYGAPILGRGGGTSLAGQCCNVAVVFDFSKYLRRIVSINPDARHAIVEPGVVLDDLRRAAERHHLTFGPDPSTHDHCTLGGMIGNNSCGVHSVYAGKTVDNVIELDVLTYDGARFTAGETPYHQLTHILHGGGRRAQLYAGLVHLRDRYADRIRAGFPQLPRRVSGYNLDELLPENRFHVGRALTGSESTCVLVLGAKLRLVHSPPVRTLLVLGYPSVYEAADHVPEILRFSPLGLEGLDDTLVEDMKKKRLHPGYEDLLPDGKGWLLLEFGGVDKRESDGQARALMAALARHADAPQMKLYDNREYEEHVWKIRESGLGATARVPGARDTWEGWEDSAVPPEALGRYLRSLRALLERYGYGAAALYGHFGQGCVHTRIPFELTTAPGIARYRAFVEEAAGLVVSLGGSLSGEHGDGQSRGELLPKMFGPELMEAFRAFKRLWDPDGKMNPGKKIDAAPLDSHLRLGVAYEPPQLRTHFAYPDDGSFARATTRCVGVGECRREGGGTMCPSYMVTREEAHSTRGRAHLLYEMLEGNPVGEGWRSPAVRSALDLCLSCKGCKSDCPVNVDMATYKAEFLAHYYAGLHFRPRSAYAIGLIYWWSRIASHVPRLANFLTHAPGLQRAFKALGGVSRARTLPRFAEVPFAKWWKQRVPRNEGSTDVILWADTFNNYFKPETAVAAVEVLEDAGFHVIVPERPLCCGRPLYDYGWLDRAKKQLLQILDALRPHLRAGTCVVGLEPSCIAVFRDELRNLLPADEDARRLADQSLMLSEFLARADYRPPPLQAKALVHGHCHHKAVMKLDAEKQLLDRIGLEWELLDSGCCGMAGGFGYERDHYDVSVKAGERVLLPAVRAASLKTFIITDGFSCREQIEQRSVRRALHVAEVLQLALRRKRAPRPLPENSIQPLRRPARAAWAAMLVVVIAIVSVLAAWTELR